MNTSIFMVYLISLTAGSAVAGAAPLAAAATEKAGFEQQIAAVRSGMQTSGRYEFVTSEERSRVIEALAEIDTLLSKHSTLSELSPDEKVAIFNAQERTNAILNQRDGERLICENIATVGSHQKRTVCQTYAEQQRRVQHDRNAIQKAQNGAKPAGDGK